MNANELLNNMKIICESYYLKCETCPLYSHNKLFLGCMMNPIYTLNIENITKIVNDWHIAEEKKDKVFTTLKDYLDDKDIWIQIENIFQIYYKRRSDYYKERVANSCASHCIKEGCRYYTETICLKQEDMVKQIEQDWIDLQHDKEERSMNANEKEFMTLEEFEKSGKYKCTENENSNFRRNTPVDIWHGIPSTLADYLNREYDPFVSGVCKAIQEEWIRNNQECQAELIRNNQECQAECDRLHSQDNNLKIYYIVRNDCAGEDEYDSAVVVAHNEEEAIEILKIYHSTREYNGWGSYDVSVKEVIPDKPRIVIESFNAG